MEEQLVQWSIHDLNLWEIAIRGGINGRPGGESVFMDYGAGRHDFNRI